MSLAPAGLTGTDRGVVPAGSARTPPLAVEMHGITKRFESVGVVANDHVDLEVRAGEVHALVGENGAGKTTLMNILYGLERPDEGTIRIHGEEVRIGHPDDAIRVGIGMVHQHFKLVRSFSVAENVMLGMEATAGGLLRREEEVAEVRRLSERFALPVDPEARVEDLPVGLQQRVEILKVLHRQARVLILDEPTAVLTPQEARDLFVVVRQLAAEGRTVILITHKLAEVLESADRVSVMRRGRMIGTKPIGETTMREMARMMVGRDVLLRVDRRPATPGAPVLEVRDLVVAGTGGVPAVARVSFQVRAGEILGVAGVTGNGQTELVEAIAGLRPVELGHVLLEGRDLARSGVADRRALGLAHVPEDRLHVGLNLQASLDENVAVTRYKQREFSRFGFLRRGALKTLARSIIDRFGIASARQGGGIATLSGGNLQKIVLGRELAGGPRLIIANQPTRGLDVGSIEFVHRTLVEARDAGAAILLVSVELDEILGLSDRMIVLYRGRVAGELSADEADEERLGILMGTGEAGRHDEPEQLQAPVAAGIAG